MRRQNEDEQFVIYLKVPSAGVHALLIYGRPWLDEAETFPHIATYLVAATAGVEDGQCFPTERIGQEKANIQ